MVFFGAIFPSVVIFCLIGAFWCKFSAGPVHLAGTDDIIYSLALGHILDYLEAGEENPRAVGVSLMVMLLPILNSQHLIHVGQRQFQEGTWAIPQRTIGEAHGPPKGSVGSLEKPICVGFFNLHPDGPLDFPPPDGGCLTTSPPVYLGSCAS